MRNTFTLRFPFEIDFCIVLLYVVEVKLLFIAFFGAIVSPGLYDVPPPIVKFISFVSMQYVLICFFTICLSSKHFCAFIYLIICFSVCLSVCLYLKSIRYSILSAANVINIKYFNSNKISLLRLLCILVIETLIHIHSTGAGN